MSTTEVTPVSDRTILPVEARRFSALAGYDVVRVDVVRVVLGIVLLVAAFLKGHELATEPIIGTGVLSSRWFFDWSC